MGKVIVVDEPAQPDDAMRAIVRRLSRPHASGGVVIERAAIVAEGADAVAIVGWILAHAGEPEAAVPVASSRGLHGPAQASGSGIPRRYVLPVDAVA